MIIFVFKYLALLCYMDAMNTLKNVFSNVISVSQFCLTEVINDASPGYVQVCLFCHSAVVMDTAEMLT